MAVNVAKVQGITISVEQREKRHVTQVDEYMAKLQRSSFVHEACFRRMLR